MSDQERLKFDFDPTSYESARLAVIGVGGAGGNAVCTMMECNVENVTLMVANTDVQALERSKISLQVQLGDNLTRGLGAGGDPNRGMKAAEESLTTIEEHIQGVDMLFIAAGMGGGTGTGAAPVIAQKARDMGILTVAVVTRPFRFEGRKRERLADEGLSRLKDAVNTLIIIPNQRLLEMEDADIPIMEAFKCADHVLVNAVRGISDLITTAGYVNVDFADVRTIMSNMGMAIMGTGYASGNGRAHEAAKAAISSPLLDNLNIKGAKGVLVNVTGSSNLTTPEVDEAVGYIEELVDPDADFIFGYVIDESMGDNMKVTVIATGLQNEESDRMEKIKIRRSFQENLDIPAVVRHQNRERQVLTRATTPSSLSNEIVETASLAPAPAAPAPISSPVNTPFNTTPNDNRNLTFARQFIEPVSLEEQMYIPSFRRRVKVPMASK